MIYCYMHHKKETHHLLMIHSKIEFLFHNYLFSIIFNLLLIISILIIIISIIYKSKLS